VTVVAPHRTADYREFLPADEPVQYLDESGRWLPGEHRYLVPTPTRLLEVYRKMVLGRRFDQQATALTKQGRLAVYPSSRGQEACQVPAAMCLPPADWMFPTYRDSVALMTRGVDPVQILSMLAGDWHCGYDPVAHHCAPQSTPLATQLLHATGLAYGELLKGRDTVTLALCGDGATSEGDFHEALNFAAVFRAPVIFLVQNNGYAISVPLARQSVAPSLAHKGVGYGIGSEHVDGNDPVAMMAVLDVAVRYVQAGKGPLVIEAYTYRIDAHTNADDATRYREDSEVQSWLARDPIARLDTYLRAEGVLDDAAVTVLNAEAEDAATQLRAGMNIARQHDPLDLFRYVYAQQTPQLREQQAQVGAELAAESEETH